MTCILISTVVVCWLAPTLFGGMWWFYLWKKGYLVEDAPDWMD